MIDVKGLKKSFKTPAGELPVLKGLDFSIADREMVAVVGASGVGKSTLLHILGTLDAPTEGTVLYDGRDVFSMDEGSRNTFRNRTIGFVFQFHHLMPEFTALENIIMPALISGAVSRKEAEGKAAALLKELGIYQRKEHRPGELSGGEQQRVAVARALILSPKVILADEPTGNLDTSTGKELFNLLYRLNNENGITFVIVTHNESLSRRCSRVIEMIDGSIKG
ncbi:MAG: ABC transporter ATP-binding protein [Thermodesulfovibrionales bacterium]|nr:ABC transporter ATP-binding protein [Thermodesulfovibrionales bacterium]